LEVLLSVVDRSKVADRVETLSPDRNKVELFSRDIVVISKKEASEEAVDSSNKVSVVLAFKGSEITFLLLTVAADRTSFSDRSLWMLVSSSRDVSIASIVLITEGLEASVF